MYPIDQLFNLARVNLDLGGRMATAALTDGMRLGVPDPLAGTWQHLLLDSTRQWSRLSANSRVCMARITLESLQSAGAMAGLEGQSAPTGARRITEPGATVESAGARVA